MAYQNFPLHRGWAEVRSVADSLITLIAVDRPLSYREMTFPLSHPLFPLIANQSQAISQLRELHPGRGCRRTRLFLSRVYPLARVWHVHVPNHRHDGPRCVNCRATVVFTRAAPQPAPRRGRRADACGTKTLAPSRMKCLFCILSPFLWSDSEPRVRIVLLFV